MKDYMVAHTFKTEELRDQYFEMSKDMTADDIRANMKNENAGDQCRDDGEGGSDLHRGEEEGNRVGDAQGTQHGTRLGVH